MYSLATRAGSLTRRITSLSPAYNSAILAMLLWATVASAFKLTLRHTEVAPMLLTASAVSLCVLFLALLREGKLVRLRQWSLGDYARSALLGALNPFLYYLLMFTSYDLLPAQFAQPVNYVWPVFLILLSALFLRQRLALRDAARMALSFTGVVIISLGGGSVAFDQLNIPGLLCALGSAAIWAVYWLLNMQESRDRSVRLFVNFAFGLLWIGIYQAVRGEFVLPAGAGLAGAVYIGLFEMGITYLLWFRALTSGASSANVGNIIYLVPFVSLLVIAAVVGEHIYTSTFAGLIFIMSGLLLGSVHRFSWAATGRERVRRLTRSVLHR